MTVQAHLDQVRGTFVTRPPTRRAHRRRAGRRGLRLRFLGNLDVASPMGWAWHTAPMRGTSGEGRR